MQPDGVCCFFVQSWQSDWCCKPGLRGARARSQQKVKVKVGFLYRAIYTVDQEQHALTISEVAVDCQEPVVLQYKCSHSLPALMDIGPAVAASKHTAPINHTRPSPHKHSPDVTTASEMAEPNYCSLFIYRPQKDERLSWPSWLTSSGWSTT